IDIKVLANRYREYIKEMQEYDLSVPAKAIRICAALLNMKAMTMYSPDESEQEEFEENPMAFEDENVAEEQQDNSDEVELEMGPELEIPVKNKPKRRMRIGELKDALESALEVHQQREERQEMRAEMDEAFEVDEDDITDKLNSLMDKITSFGSDDEEIHFDSLIEQQEREERIEKFKHVLHLENDEKVRLIQEEFLGDLHVRPEDEANN
ncbi:MAG: segregation/condensation protein A, partial [Candidatus Nanohaloarchaea archaeon]